MNTPPNALLVEGAKSYPPALAALSEFRRLVQAGCRMVLVSNREELAGAMSEDLDSKLIIDHAQPDQLGAGVDGRSAALGVKLRRKGQWRLYCCLFWRDEQLTARTGIKINNAVVADKVYSALKKQTANHPVNREENDIYISGAVSRDEMTNFAEDLQTVSQEWVGLWQRVGGLKQFQA
jgi:hypothetical protein